MALSLLDYEEIRQLLARYCHSLDFQDWDAFLDCFMPDGVFRNVSKPVSAGEHRGHEGLLAFGKSVADRTAGHVRHSTTNVLIDGDGDRAIASSYCVVSRDFGPPNGSGQSVPQSDVITTGLYVDELVKVKGRWRIAVRTFTYDGMPPALQRVGASISPASLLRREGATTDAAST
jgi:hypothetical protein